LFIIFSRLALNFSTHNIIDCAAFFSLFIGTILTLRQNEIKRFLAYSSITHVGFLLIADLTASYIYILTYLISSLLFFSVLLYLNYYNNEIIYLNDLCLIKKNNQSLPFLLVISLASMAGLPPFAGFYGKFLVWSNLIENIYLYNDLNSYLFLSLSLIFTLITIFYYMRIISYIYALNDSEFVNIPES
jgi:NADH-quinone oxidoreductase subunit N